jgi:hypothetical protein
MDLIEQAAIAGDLLEGAGDTGAQILRATQRAAGDILQSLGDAIEEIVDLINDRR